GLLDPQSGAMLRGAGDVIAWLLTTWTDLRVDAARMSAHRQRLNVYQIDTWLNDPVDPLEWLNRELVTLLPIEPRQGPDGLWFALFPTEVGPTDAVARLDANTREVQRESSIETDSSAIVNEVTVLYGPDRDSGDFRFRVTVGAQEGRIDDELEGALADSRVRADYRAALSQQQFGRRTQTIQAKVIWDPATATRIAQDVVARQALPQRFVDYSGGPDLEVLEVGQVVTLTDTAVQLDDELALVLDVEVGGPEVLLSLQLLDDPVIAKPSTP
ncbi:MAG: phage tail protein, partial [Myxococcota bacterium]